MSNDWIPIYDKSSLPGFYVAIGTSGNQFKNAPLLGQITATLIAECEAGADHDSTPVTWTTYYRRSRVNLGHFSRLREINQNSTFSVLS